MGIDPSPASSRMTSCCHSDLAGGISFFNIKGFSRHSVPLLESERPRSRRQDDIVMSLSTLYFFRPRRTSLGLELSTIFNTVVLPRIRSEELKSFSRDRSCSYVRQLPKRASRWSYYGYRPLKNILHVLGAKGFGR